MRLKEMGFEVVCGEIDTKVFKLDDVKCMYTDLNEKIDSPSDTCDYICCIDGLEHMTNPYRAVQEFARVLKTGGYGIFSIPNYSNMETQTQYFLADT